MAEVWPYVPLPEMTETPAWLNAVHVREDDTSRWGLRPPRQILNYRYAFQFSRWFEAKALFEGNALGEWHVPCWSERTQDIAVASADTVLTVDTRAEYVEGGLLIVWQGCDTYTVATIQSISEWSESGEITLTAAVGADYSSATIMPLRTCILRNGIETTRRTDTVYEVSAAFEATDNPDVTLLVEKAQFLISIDSSDSTNAVVADGITRFQFMQTNAIAFLRYLAATGKPHDVRVVSWASVVEDTIERNDCTPSDFDDLIDFVGGLAANPFGLTDASNGLDGGPAFFTGTERRIFYLLGDTNATGKVTAAVGAQTPITDLESYGINADGADSITVTDPTPSVRSDTFGIRDTMVMRLLQLPLYDGKLFLQCSGAVLSPQSGGIGQQAIYVDSGRGPVSVEADRSYVERSQAITMAEATVSGRWRLKQSFHMIFGRLRPFYATELVTPLVDVEQTIFQIASLVSERDDWIGYKVKIGDQFREINATSSGGTGIDQLQTDHWMETDLVGPVRFIREVNLLEDSVDLSCNWRAGWTRLTVSAGTP